MGRRSSKRPSGPVEAAISVVIGYAVAAIAIPFSSWFLFLWQRPDDTGAAILYEAAHSGFWRAVGWLVLVVSVVIVLSPLVRLAWDRLRA